MSQIQGPRQLSHTLSRVLGRLTSWPRSGLRRMRAGGRDAGMTTAEYAIGTVAACAFAAILYRVVTSDTVSGALSDVLDRALHAV
ncbi:DUF4244 domain-containing protein [Kitasatospora sp. MBT63]|uniref:DUF4244 domain-containing protein n=1 Tax=Kitasatospora sp. MBT63 TaxID=1444768 RepID=UPI00068B3AF1|nr:DUF4244 domain-containing protein [Kitasatospora sp. MBT63]